MIKVSREMESTSESILAKLFPSHSMRNELIERRQLETLNEKLAEVVHEMEQRSMEKRERPKKKGYNEEELSESKPAVKTIVALTTVPVGGSVMSLRDEKGHESVLIGYSRLQLVRASRSPFALLPPPTIKEIVLKTPEIIARFPRRHPSTRKSIHSMEDE